MRFIKVGVVLCSVWVLGCSHYHGAYSANHYIQNAQTIPPIQVPAGIPSPVAEQLYPVPWGVAGKPNPNPSLLPPDAYYQQYLLAQQAKKGK